MDILKAHKSPIVSNSMWNVGGRIVNIVVYPVFAILIARLLMPADYGVFNIAFAIISFLDLVKDLGISQPIIVSREEEDFVSLQFTVQLVFGSILFCSVLILSPIVAKLYGVDKLQMVLILYSLIIFIWTIESPLVTYHLKNSNYRLLFYRQIIPSILFGSSTLVLAYLGFGVYSIVFGHLLSRLATALFLLNTSGWMPRIYFRYDSFLKLYYLGRHVVFQSFSGYLVNSADSLVLGNNLSTGSLGSYKLSMNIKDLFPNVFIPQIQQVVYTELSRMQTSSDYIQKRYDQFSLLIGGASLVLSILTFVLSPIVIPFVLGDNWSAVVPLVRILSITLPTGLITGINNDLSKILNFNYVYSYFSIIRSLITLLALFAGSLYSVAAAVLMWSVVSVLSNTANDILFFSYQKTIKYPPHRFWYFGGTFVWITLLLLSQKLHL